MWRVSTLRLGSLFGSLYAFYKTLFPTAEVWLGGLYASLMPKHAAESGADYVHTGIFEEAEKLVRLYSNALYTIFIPNPNP